MNRLVESAKPSVVSISSKVNYSYTVASDHSAIPFFDKKEVTRTFSFRNVSTGIIFNKEGYIVTKSNVVQDAEQIEVNTHDNQRYLAAFIGFNLETGLAVIKIDATDLIPVPLGNSDTIKEGDWITLIGNSMGVLPSVSLGLINGIRKEDDLIQLSAFINPGNSGSPVFNTKGEVIGIVAARLNSENMSTGALFSTQPA
ncbi:trypsin-like peptidase domain-containing protein, partial [candidate division KSB1 bacterium]|nr:trypsin-like peptidase domain-containing protein [candidate division KSB1 bacterium]